MMSALRRGNVLGNNYILLANMIKEVSFKKITKNIKEAGIHNSRLMYKFPTELESKIMEILDEEGIKYKFQKLFYKFVKGSRDYIENYYIANFWIPKKKIVLDIASVPRKVKINTDSLRSYDTEGIHPKPFVIKINENDLEYPSFKQELVALLK